MRRLKGWFYWIFLITTGSLFITYHRHLAWYLAPRRTAREDSTALERPYARNSLDQVAEWRIVLEGMEGKSPITGEFNRTVVEAVTERNNVIQSDPQESIKVVSSDFLHDNHDGSHKKHFDQVNRHSMRSEEGEKEKDEGERIEDGEETRDFSDDCSLASCVTTALESEDDGTRLRLNAVRLPSSSDQSNAAEEFSVDSSACRQDLSTLPEMAKIYTEPKLNLTPIFNASVTDYYATVEHDLIVIQIKGFAVSCQVEVRLADRFGPSRLSNYTLGLGLNRVLLVVVDLMHSEPWVINTYTLNIYRMRPGVQERGFDASQPHQVCYLEQDCGLSFLPSKRCGLQSDTRYLHWDSFRAFASRLLPCSSGSTPGQWVMPCGDCGRKETCFWSIASWQPFNCTHFPLSRHRLRRCLQGKKQSARSHLSYYKFSDASREWKAESTEGIAEIKDSTNRGMMHYTMEQINGSLMESDKTHDSKVYTNVNDNQTTLSFTYYPQFWLPTNQRPLFEESLYQLIQMSQPLANDPQQTVLVVGGVHWLAVQHLNLISTLLQQSGLSNIRVIVKTLGAGFHLHVDGLHHLTLEEQRRLVLHNSILVNHARSLGFHVVDTFKMTMARYKDFLQGKCACHFHRVKQVLPSFTKFLRHSTQNGGGKLGDMPFHYHVEGEVNAVYSEILLNRICDMQVEEVANNMEDQPYQALLQ